MSAPVKKDAPSALIREIGVRVEQIARDTVTEVATGVRKEAPAALMGRLGNHVERTARAAARDEAQRFVLTPKGRAYLAHYQLAMDLGFGEEVAERQAQRAAQLAEETQR